jgi:hypothetical protein
MYPSYIRDGDMMVIIVDAMCRNLTASFVREQKEQGADVKICDFYEGYQKTGTHSQHTEATVGAAHE